MQDQEGDWRSATGRLHGLISVQMVEAGWCFDPSPEYEDGVACFYCMLSLDGWEPKDDPECVVTPAWIS